MGVNAGISRMFDASHSDNWKKLNIFNFYGWLLRVASSIRETTLYIGNPDAASGVWVIHINTEVHLKKKKSPNELEH